MKSLIKQINSLPKETKTLIETRLKEFSSFKSKSNKEWFSELCFCILTANSKAKTALAIQSELGYKGFSKVPQSKLAETIKRNKHRFHNNKSKYIVKAREHLDIKDKIAKHKTSQEARGWLAENIKGLGYKESSHFLRNVGFTDLAILDRHIINLMLEHNLLKEKSKSLNKKNYMAIEQDFNFLANKLKMSSAKLDLYMWYLKTGEVLK